MVRCWHVLLKKQAASAPISLHSVKKYEHPSPTCMTSFLTAPFCGRLVLCGRCTTQFLGVSPPGPCKSIWLGLWLFHPLSNIGCLDSFLQHRWSTLNSSGNSVTMTIYYGMSSQHYRNHLEADLIWSSGGTWTRDLSVHSHLLNHLSHDDSLITYKAFQILKFFRLNVKPQLALSCLTLF